MLGVWAEKFTFALKIEQINVKNFYWLNKIKNSMVNFTEVLILDTNTMWSFTGTHQQPQKVPVYFGSMHGDF